MDTFPSDIRFRKSWRSYQQQVLDELKDHLDDSHLHVIAAPGSGKTVLGLEVMRRLNRPALILSPTVAIRDQWIDRFVNSFMDSGQNVPAWISRDIRQPQFITASTYQGLHSVYRGEPEDEGRKTEPEERGQRTQDRRRKAGGRDALLKRLQQLGVRTLVLDEAHHLRNEWWKCLADLNKHLGKPNVVALTATAPFDVSPFEWDRYIGLCGPIDKAFWLFLWHGSIASSMKQVGKAVLKAMVQGEEIETGISQLKVVTGPLDYGFVSCSLKGGTTRERSIFLDALQEVLGPIENPRYVLVRKSLLGWLVRKDYHAVPAVLGKNKDLAEYFRKMWARHVGPTDLVYTRTPEGRRFLLKARTHSMSRSFQSRAERLKSWQ